MLIPGYDWKNPDIAGVYRARYAALLEIRKDAAAGGSMLAELRAFYREHPAHFINDWGVSFDPRMVERGLPGILPMVLFPRQREWIDWVIRRWKSQKNGMCEKTRDFGVSYLATELGCTLCLHYDQLSIGYGSRKEEYVDKAGQPKSLFWKSRLFLRNLPPEFRGGWIEWRDAPHMRISIPETQSVMTGETGDQIGRGDRQGIYFTDEDAYNPAHATIEHSISQTTNCRISISTPNGMSNTFAKKRFEPRADPDYLFICDWRDDPRKDAAWYAKQVEELDPVTVAQEIDRDYAASVEGVVIPGAWVRAAIDAAKVLGVAVSGPTELALDVADEGVDSNAVVGGRGIEVSVAEDWSGKGSDTFATVERAFLICDQAKAKRLRYDADGLGALVRGDARVINERRAKEGLAPIDLAPYRGSGEVLDPEAEDVPGRTNLDYYANSKAQNWWRLRLRFHRTWLWVTKGKKCDADEIISLDPKLPNLGRLTAELSQATWQSPNGKIVIDKSPKGMKSPNMADGVVIRFARLPAGPLVVTDDVLARAALLGRGRRR